MMLSLTFKLESLSQEFGSSTRSVNFESEKQGEINVAYLDNSQVIFHSPSIFKMFFIKRINLNLTDGSLDK